MSYNSRGAPFIKNLESRVFATHSIIMVTQPLLLILLSILLAPHHPPYRATKLPIIVYHQLSSPIATTTSSFIIS